MQSVKRPGVAAQIRYLDGLWMDDGCDELRALEVLLCIKRALAKCSWLWRSFRVLWKRCRGLCGAVVGSEGAVQGVGELKLALEEL